MLYPDGKKVEYHYNAKNQLTSVNDDKQTVQFTYSPLGKLLTKEFNGIYRQTCDFLPNGRLKNTKLYKNDEFVFEKNYNFNNLGLLSEEHDVDISLFIIMYSNKVLFNKSLNSLSSDWKLSFVTIFTFSTSILFFIFKKTNFLFIYQKLILIEIIFI